MSIPQRSIGASRNPDPYDGFPFQSAADPVTGVCSFFGNPLQGREVLVGRTGKIKGFSVYPNKCSSLRGPLNRERRMVAEVKSCSCDPVRAPP